MFDKVLSGLVFFFLLISLYFWWVSQSSSISLLMVLVFSILMAVDYSLKLDTKVVLFMMVLTLSGGLFVLISFVIMFFPSDYKVGVINSKGMYFFLFMSFFLSFFSLKESGLLFSKVEVMEEGIKVWGNFIFVYIFLIILLFLFLFLVNFIVNMNTGSMFSSKKFKGGGK